MDVGQKNSKLQLLMCLKKSIKVLVFICHPFTKFIYYLLSILLLNIQRIF